jgi:hypothetical protein
MNLDYKQLLPSSFNDNSKVWIYQSSRAFTEVEILQIENELQNFVATWNSHGAKVNGYGHVFFNQFIVLMADETAASVSGCSTDSSVHIIKKIEKDFSVDLFNRQNLALYRKEKIELLPLSQLNYAIENEFITADTLYFNNTVVTKKAFENNWIIPLSKSWLGLKVAH